MIGLLGSLELRRKCLRGIVVVYCWLLLTCILVFLLDSDRNVLFFRYFAWCS